MRWQPGLFGGPGSTVPVCDAGPATATPKVRSKPVKARGLRALRFTPRASVSADITERLVARFSHEGDAAAVRAELQRIDPMAQTTRSLRAVGFSPRDLGDAYAHAFLVLWTVVNAQPTVSERAVEGVRKDLRAQLARDAKTRRASDARQQAQAEWLGSWTAIVATSANAFAQSGDAAAAAEWRRQARGLARDLLGLDLTRVKPTSRGVARR